MIYFWFKYYMIWWKYIADGHLWRIYLIDGMYCYLFTNLMSLCQKNFWNQLNTTPNIFRFFPMKASLTGAGEGLNLPQVKGNNYCQNPNLITTQRNLNLRLGLTRLLLFTTHPPPPPPRNSTSTRNKGPSGLKFCMRPHLTKLARTQQNFNPTIFWVGGSATSPKVISKGTKIFN